MMDRDFDISHSHILKMRMKQMKYHGYIDFPYFEPEIYIFNSN